MSFIVGEYCEIKGIIIDVGVHDSGSETLVKHAYYFPYTHASKHGNPHVLWIGQLPSARIDLAVNVGDIVDIPGFVTEISYQFNEETKEVEKDIVMRTNTIDGYNRYLRFSEEDYVNFLEGLNDRDRT